MSAHAARFMVEQIQKRACISTDLIDLLDLPMPIDDAGEEIKDSTFSNRMTIADAMVIVTPEYNHSFPGFEVRGVTSFARIDQLIVANGAHNQTLPDFGINFRATPLLHQRFPVGGGPSLKTWPWWPPQRAQ